MHVLVIGDSGPLTRQIAGALACSGAQTPAATPFEVQIVAAPALPAADSANAADAADAGVYLAGARGRPGVPDAADAAAALAALGTAGARRWVVVASAEASAPSHRHPGLAAEDRPRPLLEEHPIAAAWLELENVARATARHHGATLTILRPAAVPVRGGRDLWSRRFSGFATVTLPGHDPTLQVLAVEDLAGAIAAALAHDGDGTFHVAPRAPAPLWRALRAARVVRVPVPRWLQRLARPALARWRLAAPLASTDYLRYSWTVSGERLERELGWAPRHSSLEALRALRPTHPTRATRPTPAPLAAPPDPDPFGLDPAYIAACARTQFRFLHDLYWRIEASGLAHVPARGPVVLVGVHRGFMPFDGVMALHQVRRATGRLVRFLVHPTLLKDPYLSYYMTRLGGIPACQENADRVLREGGILGIFPEGIRGAFTYYREAYQLKPFGRDQFARMALRHGAPIVPFVTVGSAEIFPIFGKLHWRWWKRIMGWPCLPITPTFPWLPVPLPTKWHTEYLPPLEVEVRFPRTAAEDPRLVRALSAETRERLASALADLRSRRRSLFRGALVPRAAAPPASAGSSR